VAGAPEVLVTHRLRPAALAVFTLVLLGTGGCERDAKKEQQAGDAARALATYVGGDQCETCHAPQADLWRGSHHARAMQAADPKTVLGDFRDGRLSRDGVDTTFFQRDGRFWVRTDGADGRLADFRVAYTFGVAPLQQYLLELPGGRLQALSIAWDARPKDEGGQRWFHLYPNEKIDHRDVLHWTGPAQNWNHMCAECHSTNLQKNYRAQEARFETTSTDVNVNCEACHGPGSRHVAWAQSEERVDEPSWGLVFRLADRASAQWVFNEGATIASRSAPLERHVEVETCGRCHSRRANIWPQYEHGQPLAQTHRVALLDDTLYQPDGQMLDEVYEYGSFLQSRMYAAGVTCSDCHEPHSGQLRAAGNAVCAQCHQAAHYDTAGHHHHEAQTPGAECVSCHMAERNYMVIDGRRDHSFRVPRPDLTVSVDTPNACNGCHSEQSAKWAAAAVVKWFGPERQRGPLFAEAIHAGRRSSTEAEALLRATIENRSLPAIARASALTLLPRYLTPDSLLLVEDALRDPDELVRRSALEALAVLDPQMRVSRATSLLLDPIRTVRLEAVGALLDAPRSAFSTEQQQALERGIEEFRDIQAFNADRADAQANLGMLETRLGNSEAAQQAFRRAIELQPSFSPAYVNLADLYRSLGREQDAERTLRAALEVDRDNADAHAALGLALVRQKRLPEAVTELARAAKLVPEVPRYAYLHAVALHETGGRSGAIRVLTRAYERHPSDRDILVALVEYHVEAGDRAGARRWAQRLADIAPSDASVQNMFEQLQQ
jgi:tetratricopeptide (TPR) repeat protein